MISKIFVSGVVYFMIKLIAFDLDGTLTQHKTPLEPENLAVLTDLSRKYRLLMVGAGGCFRIFEQLGRFPIDIIGNYGMQYARYDAVKGTLDIVENHVVPCDRDRIERRVTMLRERYGFTSYSGDNVQYHDSGCVTFPILGTEALLADKLTFDPDRKKRRAIYAEVCDTFPEYNVFVGGSSSFDMAPKPFDKRYALDKYCREYGFSPMEVLFAGDDYGQGGNDESVYQSDFGFLQVDDYKAFPKVIAAADLL